MDADPDGAARVLDAALALWRGPAYGEFASGFAQAPRFAWTSCVAAPEDRVELLLRTGAATDAVAAARDLVGAEPLRDRPVELLMRALHAGGRVAEALDAYRDHRSCWPRSSASTLRRAARAGGAHPPGRPAGPGAGRSLPQRPRRPVPGALPGRPGAMVGREDDLAISAAAWRPAAW